jgi:hypothetical protein
MSANYFWLPTMFEPFKLVSSEDLDFAWRTLPEDERRDALFADRNPAFGVAELGVMMSDIAHVLLQDKNAWKWHLLKEGWGVPWPIFKNYDYAPSDILRSSKSFATQAQCLADLLVYLIHYKKRVSAAACNERLKNA